MLYDKYYVLKKSLMLGLRYLNLYNTWSSYEPENEWMVIVFTSIYGHTREAVELLEEKIEGKRRYCKSA